MSDTTRHRDHLIQHEGETVEVRRAYIRRLGDSHCQLVKVNRTRALVQLDNAPLRLVSTPHKHLVGMSRQHLEPEQWTVPLDWLLVPGCLESDPRQRPLFTDA